MAEVTVADVIVPRIFDPYVRQVTERKSRLVQSGVITVDAALSGKLSGGGLTFDVPSWRDLANDDDNVSDDVAGNRSIPAKIQTSNEVAVRLSRNKSWSSMDLSAALAGDDPMLAIGSGVGRYWASRLQAAVIATVQGMFADNAAAPVGADTHIQGDMTVDLSPLNAGVFQAGLTDFTAESFIDAVTTMGDSEDDLGAIMVHSIVYSKMQKNNLIDFIPDARGEVEIPTFLGRRVIRDDGMPNPAGVAAAATTAGIYHTWIMGTSAVRWGVGTPRVATEVEREAAAGNGGGQEILFNRVEWCIHPVGHAYIGAPPVGGPNNTAAANNLANAGSWRRVYPERKQIKIARLITREA